MVHIVREGRIYKVDETVSDTFYQLKVFKVYNFVLLEIVILLYETQCSQIAFFKAITSTKSSQQ